MRPEELTPPYVADVLAGAALVYFDGRLTEAALVLARAAVEAGVPVLVEAERLRPGLEELLQLADLCVTWATFQGIGQGRGASGMRLPPPLPGCRGSSGWWTPGKRGACCWSGAKLRLGRARSD